MVSALHGGALRNGVVPRAYIREITHVDLLPVMARYPRPNRHIRDCVGSSALANKEVTSFKARVENTLNQTGFIGDGLVPILRLEKQCLDCHRSSFLLVLVGCIRCAHLLGLGPSFGQLAGVMILISSQYS